MTIVSPFDESGGDEAVATQEAASIGEGPFELTWDNVEMVLDEMRPYLIQDGEWNEVLAHSILYAPDVWF